MEQESAVSKKRAPNYTNNEKEILLNIIDKHKNVIENKKTDGVSVKEKKASWQKICEEFNSVSPNMYNRPMDSLKKYYEKMKEDLRKRAAESKRELYKTGGGPGPRPEPNNSQDELLLSIINKKSVVGLGSTFDSNRLIENSGEFLTNTQSNLDNSATSLTLINEVELSDIEYINQKDTSNQSEYLEASSNNNNTIEIIYEQSDKPTVSHIWKKAENLKRPVSTILKENVNKTIPSKKKCETPSRRRPNTVVSLTSSKLGEKYEILIDKKLELVECLKKEHELRMQTLQLDIQLKKKQLTSSIDRNN